MTGFAIPIMLAMLAVVTTAWLTRSRSYEGGCERELISRNGAYSPNPDRYAPRCRPCHRAHDAAMRRESLMCWCPLDAPCHAASPGCNVTRWERRCGGCFGQKPAALFAADGSRRVWFSF